MGGAALNAVQAGCGWERIFNNQLSGLISNAKRITVITDHINQFSKFNAIDIDNDPAHVEGQYVDSIGFHCEGQFHCSPPEERPLMAQVTAL